MAILLAIPAFLVIAALAFVAGFLVPTRPRLKSHLATFALVSLGFALVSLVATILLFPLLEEPCPWDPWIDTVCAPGFTEEKFLQIRPGMTREEVEKALGPPLEKSNHGEGQIEDWQYTRDGGCLLWDFAWQSRTVLILDDRVFYTKSAECHD